MNDGFWIYTHRVSEKRDKKKSRKRRCVVSVRCVVWPRSRLLDNQLLYLKNLVFMTMSKFDHESAPNEAKK